MFLHVRRSGAWRMLSTSSRLSRRHLLQPRGAAVTEPEPPLLALPPHYELHREETHCLIGVNGSGKSRLLRRLQEEATNHTPSGSSSRRRAVRVGALSFDAHRALLAEHGDRVVAELLGGIGSPDARDLIVRLGLYPVWESRIRVLSTGEMRKVLLALALLERPRADVLLLDQPFDGLDTAARKQLEWMLMQLTRGFTRLLVDTGGRNDAFAYKTPVVMVANRLDQLLPEMVTHAVLVPKHGNGNIEVRSLAAADEETMRTQLERFLRDDASASRRRQLPIDSGHDRDDAVEAMVRQLYDDSSSAADDDQGADTVAIEMQGLSIAYDRRLLLDDVHFSRKRREHWALLGPNGSGKSSLMRVLMQAEGHGQVGGTIRLAGDRVAVVSTDQHVEMLGNVETARKTALRLVQDATHDDESVASTVLQLLNIPQDTATRPFDELSQGEQKLVQIAAALAKRPDFLLLDEITHGLDMWNRARVLQVIDAVGRIATHRTHMVLITHHEDEITPCFQSIVEIMDHQLVCRSRQQ